MPYRGSRVADPRKPTPDAGIVGDMVRQFSDRYAFLRELVQNGIDAGASRIVVRLERDGDGAARTSVDDDGHGMTRATIEGPLLTLFSSSKESDRTKIGKYGIGFVSVFAIEPDRVDVSTRAAEDSAAWLVRLFGDHSFELAVGTRAERGTTVTLAHVMTPEQFASHAMSAAAALSRWCRHAHVPILLEVAAAHDAVESRRINAPFGFPGRLSVERAEAGERIVVSVGDRDGDHAEPLADEAAPEEAPSFGGFYNRGLTLFEGAAPEEGLEGVRFKVDSPRLSHTISRDSVRRDGELDRVLVRVRELAHGELFASLERKIAAAAFDSAKSARAAPELPALLRAATAPAFRRRLGTIALPLVEPIGGAVTTLLARAIDACGGELVVEAASTPLTHALAREGVPVVRSSGLEEPLRLLYAAHRGDRFVAPFAASELFTLTTAVPPTEGTSDHALLAELARLLAATGRATFAVRLARFAGAGASESFRVLATRSDEVLDRVTSWQRPGDEAKRRPWGRAATLFMDIDDASVRLARKRARADVGVAAHLLCRAVLLADGPIAAKDVDRLLAACPGAPRA